MDLSTKTVVLDGSARLKTIKKNFEAIVKVRPVRSEVDIDCKFEPLADSLLAKGTLHKEVLLVSLCGISFAEFEMTGMSDDLITVALARRLAVDDLSGVCHGQSS